MPFSSTWRPRVECQIIGIPRTIRLELWWTEFCIGTISEMPGGDVYAAIDRYSQAGRLAYVHLRNVQGKAPNYHEMFVDDGDTDMLRVLRILHKNGFDGVLIPDHTPLLECEAPWHAGMAFALGWMRAAMTLIERE